MKELSVQITEEKNISLVKDKMISNGGIKNDIHEEGFEFVIEDFKNGKGKLYILMYQDGEIHNANHPGILDSNCLRVNDKEFLQQN